MLGIEPIDGGDSLERFGAASGALGAYEAKHAEVLDKARRLERNRQVAIEEMANELKENKDPDLPAALLKGAIVTAQGDEETTDIFERFQRLVNALDGSHDIRAITNGWPGVYHGTPDPDSPPHVEIPLVADDMDGPGTVYLVIPMKEVAEVSSRNVVRRHDSTIRVPLHSDVRFITNREELRYEERQPVVAVVSSELAKAS